MAMAFVVAHPAALGATFTFEEVMIPVRDGVKLHTLIFSSKGARGGLPILFLRTPYGVDSRSAILVLTVEAT